MGMLYLNGTIFHMYIRSNFRLLNQNVNDGKVGCLDVGDLSLGMNWREVINILGRITTFNVHTHTFNEYHVFMEKKNVPTLISTSAKIYTFQYHTYPNVLMHIYTQSAKHNNFNKY